MNYFFFFNVKLIDSVKTFHDVRISNNKVI